MSSTVSVTFDPATQLCVELAYIVQVALKELLAIFSQQLRAFDNSIERHWYGHAPEEGKIHWYIELNLNTNLCTTTMLQTPADWGSE